jgi:hypothetical protein
MNTPSMHSTSIASLPFRRNAMFARKIVTLSLIGLFAATAAHADVFRIGNATPKDGSGSGSGSWIGYVFGSNQASGTNSAVAAGSFNLASGQGSFIGAGTANQAAGISSLVIGGFDNHAMAIDSLVGAGAGNYATGPRAVVVGGGYNLASGPWSFIGGGGRETGAGAAGASAQDHIAAGKWATIAGGKGNRAGNGAAHTGPTVAGGEQNQALNTDATVAGGTLNVASGLYSTIGGGQSNTANNTGATVGGGSGNTASGQYASVPGGNGNTASGNYSVAAGRQAKAVHAGSLVLADSSAFDFNSAANNEFAVRATGGARIVTAISGAGTPTAGVTVAAGGGSWASLSDRNAKQDLVEVDGATVLARLAAMPVYTWRYKTETSGALHMGPTAQDFHAAFGLGDSDQRITTVDADGVALAAIKALHASLQQKDATLAAQGDELAALEQRIAQVEVAQKDVAVMKAAVARLLQERAARATTAAYSRSAD